MKCGISVASLAFTAFVVAFMSIGAYQNGPIAIRNLKVWPLWVCDDAPKHMCEVRSWAIAHPHDRIGLWVHTIKTTHEWN